MTFPESGLATTTADPSSSIRPIDNNGAIISKDLPGYVCQFMVFSWKWSDYNPHKGYEKLFLHHLPIEKLQVMIDK